LIEYIELTSIEINNYQSRNLGIAIARCDNNHYSPSFSENECLSVILAFRCQAFLFVFFLERLQGMLFCNSTNMASFSFCVSTVVQSGRFLDEFSMHLASQRIAD